VMQKQVRDGLTQMGYEIEDQRLMPADLLSADMVILTNSLIGAVPVIALDGQAMRYHPDLCRRICRQVGISESC